MVQKTCAACDCELDGNAIQVKIGGNTVEVCRDERALKLREANTSAAMQGRKAMSNSNSPPTPRSIQTMSGCINYVEQGTGPVALFVHGVLLNGHLWRHQLAHLSDMRRCIALDLLAHGGTEITDVQDVSVTANAHMIKEFLDALDIDQVDLVGNDSGGGIAQIFAALNPHRVRSLSLTDRDAQDNWPPEAFKPFLGNGRRRRLARSARGDAVGQRIIPIAGSARGRL